MQGTQGGAARRARARWSSRTAKGPEPRGGVENGSSDAFLPGREEWRLRVSSPSLHSLLGLHASPRAVSETARCASQCGPARRRDTAGEGSRVTTPAQPTRKGVGSSQPSVKPPFLALHPVLPVLASPAARKLARCQPHHESPAGFVHASRFQAPLIFRSGRLSWSTSSPFLARFTTLKTRLKIPSRAEGGDTGAKGRENSLECPRVRRPDFSRQCHLILWAQHPAKGMTAQ